MNKNITIKDIAKAAGVSTGTVDRVIHGRGNVSPKKRSIVLKIMNELGYEKNLIASALALNKNFRIAVLLPDPEIDIYWKGSQAGVQSAMKSVKHYGVSCKYYLFNLFKPNSFMTKANELFEDKPDAILFAPVFTKESKGLLDKAKELGIPNVMINTNIKNADSLSFVGPDSYQSGVLAGRLLNLHRGKKATVVILNLSIGTKNAQHLLEKTAGFKAYYINAQMVNTEVVKYDFEAFDNEDEMKAFMQRIILRHPNLEGIFVTNSRVFRVVESLSLYQLRKVKIIGFDLLEKNIAYLKSEKIDFLINQNSVQQGYLGVLSLFNHIFLKQEIVKTQNLPLDIVVKENHSYYLQKEDSFQITI